MYHCTLPIFPLSYLIYLLCLFSCVHSPYLLHFSSLSFLLVCLRYISLFYSFFLISFTSCWLTSFFLSKFLFWFFSFIFLLSFLPSFLYFYIFSLILSRLFPSYPMFASLSSPSLSLSLSSCLFAPFLFLFQFFVPLSCFPLTPLSVFLSFLPVL